MVTEEKNALAGVVRGAGALLATAGVALSLAACGGQPASAPATDQAAATTSSSTAAAGTPMTVVQAEGTPAPVIEVSDEDLENHTVTSESGTTYVDNQLVITYGPSQADDLEGFKQAIAEQFGGEYIGTGDGYNSIVVRFDHTMTLEDIGTLIEQIRQTFPGCSAKHRDPTVFAS